MMNNNEEPQQHNNNNENEQQDKISEYRGNNIEIEGSVSGSNIAGRDIINNIYEHLPVPEVVKNNARLITIAYTVISEAIAIIATIGDIRRWQTETFPPESTPKEILENLPLPSIAEMLSMFIKNNFIVFGGGILLLFFLIFTWKSIQNKK